MSKAARWRIGVGPLELGDDWEVNTVRLRERFESNPFWALLGVKVEALGPGWSRLHCIYDPPRHGPWPHGGLLASMVDMAVAAAVYTTYGDDRDLLSHATSDLNVTYIDAIEGNDLYAEGRIVRKGRAAAFGAVEVRDGHGRVLALGRATYLLRRGTRQ